jgi:hypothetical protein
MADEPDNIVLVYLRKLDEKVDRIAADVGDIKTRLTNVEERMGQFDLRLAQVDIRLRASTGGSTASRRVSTGLSVGWTSSSCRTEEN